MKKKINRKSQSGESFLMTNFSSFLSSLFYDSTNAQEQVIRRRSYMG
jgi:hypothetical protein